MPHAAQWFSESFFEENLPAIAGVSLDGPLLVPGDKEEYIIMLKIFIVGDPLTYVR